MQLRSLLLMVAAVVTGVVQLCACDVCGCGSGSGSLGLLPMVPRHFIGFRGQYQAFATIPHGSGSPSTEAFHTLDLWVRWQAHPRIQVLAIAPFVYNNRNYQDGIQQQTQGFGDATLLAQWSVLNPRTQATRRRRHAFQLGGGIKLPTGAYQQTSPEGEKYVIHQQPGTGSTDFILTGFYALQQRRWGFSLDATYKLCGLNKAGYQLGNRLGNNLRVFAVLKKKRLVFLPHTGFSSEMSDTDRLQGKTQGESGGKALFASLGGDLFFKQALLGFNAQLPVVHALARGYVTPRLRFNATATWLFGKKTKAVKMVVPQVFPDVRPSGKEARQ